MEHILVASQIYLFIFLKKQSDPVFIDSLVRPLFRREVLLHEVFYAVLVLHALLLEGVNVLLQCDDFLERSTR